MKSTVLISSLLAAIVCINGCGGSGGSVGSTGSNTSQPTTNGSTSSSYSIEQAISDQAQLNTIAFSGLAFITGTFGCDTFLPPGKVSDYFGFQYMRDIQPNGMGHNTDFLTKVANNVLYVLTDSQRAQLIALGQQQEGQIEALAQKRFPLIKAFCRLLDGDLPNGTTGLDKAAVVAYTADIFEADGQLAYDRAVVCGGIIKSLTDEQKAYLANMKFDDYTTWPEVQSPLDQRTMSHTVNVLVMTYASEMFSWYAGSVEADTYFCPERHGTYFGGFYMKDAPAMGQANYSIPTNLTGDSGAQFLSTLTTTQRERITSIVDLQRSDLQEMVTVRRAIAAELRKCMASGTADEASVLSLSRRYGELDGEMSYYYATRFAEVGRTLTEQQMAAFVTLRNLSTTPSGAFLYSEPIALPDTGNTDTFFGTTGG